MVAAIGEARPHQLHWYLAELGTDPSARGLGFGAQLIRTRLAHCDDTGAPAYLEASEGNVAYYQRYGFTVTRPIPIPSGPTIYGMLRPPS
ncbi:GNAT family N-acetyltransferase [Pseudonocardia spinosispora]|uniref:GNAT family N-acetyltransferase n=1 Tax=Pseudonocardia spinosispora TaxID=103441 RepID=UPI00041AB1E1|nr:GNAT family N-acetyltransferase [Pseudonocardia spinosispora]